MRWSGASVSHQEWGNHTPRHCASPLSVKRAPRRPRASVKPSLQPLAITAIATVRLGWGGWPAVRWGVRDWGDHGWVPRDDCWGGCSGCAIGSEQPRHHEQIHFVKLQTLHSADIAICLNSAKRSQSVTDDGKRGRACEIRGGSDHAKSTEFSLKWEFGDCGVADERVTDGSTAEGETSKDAAKEEGRFRA